MSDRQPSLKEDTSRVLDYVRQYRREFHGMSPSVREIAKACFMGVSQVVNHLDILVAHGIIQRQEGRARGIWIVEKDQE